MIVGIMQPYFLPYIGYFQLIGCCDAFVLHDDVQYIKHGWVNRNRILVNGAAAYVTLPLVHAPHTLKICQRVYHLSDARRGKIVRQIEGAYRKAPHFVDSMTLIRDIMSYPETNVARFNENVIRTMATWLGLQPRIVRSSDLAKRTGLTGQERVLEICRAVGATQYLNPIGGLQLYSGARFRQSGITLGFLKSVALPYSQFGDAHVSNLSIIDVLMFNDRGCLADRLSQFRLTMLA